MPVKEQTTRVKHYCWGMAKNRTPPRETLARNLQILLDRAGWSAAELSRKTDGEVSPKHVTNILNRTHGAGIETANALAKPFGLLGWQLLVPDLPDELVGNGRIREMVENYLASTDEGRELLDKMAAREAKRKAE